MIRKIVIAVALLLVAGCIPASQQEVQALTNKVAQIVPLVREAVSASSDATKEKIEIVLEQVEEINEAVATTDDPIEAIEKGWAASEPFNPYYGYGLLGIGLLKLFRDKKKIGAKYQAHKEGAEKFRVENPEKSAELYNDIGAARERNGVA